MKNKLVLTLMVISLSFLLFGCGTNTETEKEMNASDNVEETIGETGESDTEETTESNAEQQGTEQEKAPETEEKEPVTEKPETEEKESVTEEPKEEEKESVTEEPKAEEDEPVADGPTAEVEGGFKYEFEGRYWVEYGEFFTCGYYYDGTNETNVYENGKKFVRPYSVEDGCIVITYNSGYTGKLAYDVGDESFVVYPDDGSMEIGCVEVDKAKFEELFGDVIGAEEKPATEEKEQVTEDPKTEEKEPVTEDSKTEEKEPATEDPKAEEKDPVTEKPATEEKEPTTGSDTTEAPKAFQYAFEGRYWLEEGELWVGDVGNVNVVYYYDGMNEDGFYKTNEFFRKQYSVVDDCIVFGHGSSFVRKYRYSVEGDRLTMYSTDGDEERHFSEVKRTDFESIFNKKTDVEDQPVIGEFDTQRPDGVTYDFEGRYWVSSYGTSGYYFDGTHETYVYNSGSEVIKKLRPYSVVDGMVHVIMEDFEMDMSCVVDGENNLRLLPVGEVEEMVYKEVDKAEFDRLFPAS